MTNTLRLLAPGLLLCCAGAAVAAGPDNNVEWNGLSHIGWQDRSPPVPVRDEAFTVRFQSYRLDLTSARVRQFVDGTPTRFFDASVIAQRGPYDIWEALVDGRDAGQASYDIEVTDGTDTDYLGAGGVGDESPAGGPILLDFDTFEHAPAGSTPVSGGTVFRVWAPGTTDAFVRGSFNGWSLVDEMTRYGEDFIHFVPGADPGDQYKYYFSDSDTYKEDAFAHRVDPSNFNNTVIVDFESYEWQTEPFAPPPFGELVCYQLHVGTFAGRNDPLGATPNPSRFVDVAARVGHLVELGINCVYLNPVIEFPGDFSGGYNPINNTAIEEALGTPDEFKAMVDAMHAEGIAVILDVVYNHIDPGSNYLYFYLAPNAGGNIYFDTPPADTPFGPQLDIDRERVRQFILDAVIVMFDEYRLDGFRVDGVEPLIYGPQPGPAVQLLTDMNALAENRWADKLMLAEIFGDDPWISRGLAFGGLGFDAQYHTEFKDAVRNATFAAAFGDPDVGRLNSAATRSDELQGTRVFNYFELHDETWPLNGFERAVRDIDPSAPHDDEFAAGRTKLAHGITLLSRGIPAILHGTEWLEDEGWEFNKIDWSHKTTYAGIFDFYSDLITLRTTRPALFADRGAWNYHTNEADNVFAFERYESGGGSFVVLANFGNGDYTGAGAYRVGLPRGGRWGVAINSEAAQYMGSGVGSAGVFDAEAIPMHGFPQSLALELPAHGFLLLEHEPAGDTDGDGVNDDTDNCTEAANPDQRDTDGDGYGNLCDPDLNNDGQVNFGDLAAFKAVFLTADEDADFNGDGSVTFGDLAIIKAFFLGSPGPAAGLD